ncbi:MAG: [citrate (pro-3S)-lyase] ligase, partial [bacterium]
SSPTQRTGIYNAIMADELPKAGIACRVIPRRAVDGRFISASDARKALHDGDMAAFQRLVPETTYAWFNSPEAAPILARIRAAGNVVHY